MRQASLSDKEAAERNHLTITATVDETVTAELALTPTRITRTAVDLKPSNAAETAIGANSRIENGLVSPPVRYSKPANWITSKDKARRSSKAEVCVTCLVRQACQIFSATPTRMIPNALRKGGAKSKKKKTVNRAADCPKSAIHLISTRAFGSIRASPFTRAAACRSGRDVVKGGNIV